MKKSILLLIAGFFIVAGASAQSGRHVLGLRFGSNSGFGTEISYQRNLSELNRYELDLGFNSHHESYLSGRYNLTTWGLTGSYHWVNKLDTNLNWFVGPGAKIGSWSYSQDLDYRYNNGLFLAAVGVIGMEYLFPVGIQLALDARPEIGLINHGTVINVGFAVRYQFK